MHRRRARGNNPEKNAAMRAFGAEVVEHGRDFDEAREQVEQIAADREGVRYVHSANEPLLIAGVATYALEIFEELPRRRRDPRADWRRQRRLRLRARPDGARQPREGHRRAGRARRRLRPIVARATRASSATSADTFAEGMATRVTFDLPFGILKRELWTTSSR